MPAATSSQATRLPLQLRAINYNDFTLVWPVSGVFHKTSAHWIVPHIVPFFTVTFVGCAECDQRIRAAKDGATLA